MDAGHTAVMREGVALSLQARITFPEVVRRLIGIGVERYHADYGRLEKTFYMPDGQSLVVPMEHPALPVADAFSAAGVEGAIRAIQRGEIDYPRFLTRTAEAGCVGYFVLLAGQQAQYFGRRGEVHIEPFPAPASA